MSKDVTTVFSLVVAFFTLQIFILGFIQKIQETFRTQVQRAIYTETLDTPVLMQLFRETATFIITTLLPILIIIGLATIIIVMFQTRFLVSYEQIKFKLERISPIKGFKRMFSLRSLVELTKSLLKISLLTWLLYGNVQRVIEALPGMVDWDVMAAAAYTGKEIIALAMSVGIAFGAVAALDYLYQRWEYEKNIRMSKQEVKDEYKQMEGNPEIKSARKQKAREYAMGRMMEAVKEADVVVRNPTHYAVALKYELDVDVAPMVLAKGADNIAQRIVEEAEKQEITTVENKSLARGLYEMASIDEVIPAEFYQPVAELLAWLYSTKEKK